MTGESSYSDCDTETDLSYNCLDVKLAPPKDVLQARRGALTPDPQIFEVNDEDRTKTSDNVLLLPGAWPNKEGQMSLRAFSSGQTQTFLDLRRTSAASRTFFEEQKLGNNCNNVSLRSKWVFRKLFEWSNRAKAIEMVRQAEKALSSLKADTEYSDPNLTSCHSDGCKEFLESQVCSLSTGGEKKRIQAVIELFQTELFFLFRRLLILRNVFREPLKKCQVEGYLLGVDPTALFGNLEDLCENSYHFAKLLHERLETSLSMGTFGSADILCGVFSNFFQSSTVVGAFQAYCINYTSMLEYLEDVRKTEERFVEFEKVCTSDRRCQKLRLEDFLIAPLQRITRIPLLIREIRRHTFKPSDQALMDEIIKSLDASLHTIDANIKWLYEFERLQELQSLLIWPPVSELNPKMYIPDFMKFTLSRQFCEKLLAHPRRKLIYEGLLTYIAESQKRTEVYAFLFNDMFILTKIKKSSSKTRKSSNVKDRKIERYVVQKQPIPLDCCVFCEVNQSDATSSSLKHPFIILQLTRFCQLISMFTFEAPTKDAKRVWTLKFQESIESYEPIHLQDMIKTVSILQRPGHQSPSTPTPSPYSSPRGSLSLLTTLCSSELLNTTAANE